MRYRAPLPALAAFFVLSIGTAFADPRGLWLAQDGAHVRVSACGRALCGILVRTKTPSDPDTGQPWTDKNNRDESQRDRPLLGVEVFISMAPESPGRWTGELYDTNTGQVVTGHIIETGPSTIRVEGCLGALCGGQTMTRLQ